MAKKDKEMPKNINDLTQEEMEYYKRKLQKEHQKLVYRESKGEDVAKDLQKNEQLLQKLDEGLNSAYQRLAKKNAPRKPIWKNTWHAFLIGGVICTLGQVIILVCQKNFLMEFKSASAMASCVVIILTALLTGIGIYDEIGRFGGAGSMVPITGFANSITSAALEFKREGMIYGIGAKIFTVAGPVILYGLVASVIIGIFTYLGGS